MNAVCGKNKTGGVRIVQVDEETVCFCAAAWDDHKKMQELREDFFSSGRCSVLAGLLLPGMQIEGS